MLGAGHAETFRSQTWLRLSQSEAAQSRLGPGVASCSPEARAGSGLPRPRVREGGGTEPQGGHAWAGWDQGGLLEGRTTSPPLPASLQLELRLVSFLGDVHLFSTCFFFLAPQILLPRMDSTRSFLLSLA